MSKPHSVILRYPRSKEEVSVTTTMLNVYGFDWKIETVETIVEDDEDDGENQVETWIGIKFTNLKSEDTSKWLSRADLLVELLDEDKDTRYAKRFTGTFTPEHYSVDIKKIVDKETILEDDEFWKDGHCAIRVTIMPIGVNGNQFHKRVEVDWRENHEFADCCIQVQDEKFFVGKATLARHSKFFESIVSSVENPFVLQRLKKEDFRLFLDYVHRVNDAEINEGNVLIFIETASRFKAEAVLAKADKFLMKTDSFDLCKKIDLAHQYALPRLKARCAFLIQLCSIEDIQNIMRSPNRSNWSSEFLHCAHERMLSAMGELQAAATKNMQRDQQQQQLLQLQQQQLQHQQQWITDAKQWTTQILRDIFNHAQQQMQNAQFPVQFAPPLIQVNQLPVNQPMLINNPQFAPPAQQQQLLLQPVAHINALPQPIPPAQQLHQPAPPQHVNVPNPPVPAPVPAPIPVAPPVAPQGTIAKRPRVNGPGPP